MASKTFLGPLCMWTAVPRTKRIPCGSEGGNWLPGSAEGRVSRQVLWEGKCQREFRRIKSEIFCLTKRTKSEIIRPVLRGGLCLQFTPRRRQVFGLDAATFHQPQQDSFLSALMPKAQNKWSKVLPGQRTDAAAFQIERRRIAPRRPRPKAETKTAKRVRSEMMPRHRLNALTRGWLA